MKPLGAGDPASVGEGRYRLVGRLGQGGMGVVYFGRSRSGRAVAVKVVRPELSTEPGFRRRFADEVAAARRVGGFHTAPVVDADPEGEPAWLVTAYIPGPTLRDVLDQVGPLPADTLTVLAAGLAEALAAIHQAGVIHRDLKPANIIVAEDGPRVIDFGIARALDGAALTQTGFQIGTLGFLAPEQLVGGTLTPAVDMFALGVVLSQAAGGAPFGDGGSAAWAYRVVHEQPDLTNVPDPLRGLVAACLAKDPLDRPRPSEFLDQLTVRHPSDTWLPAEATALIRRQAPEADLAAADRPSAAPTDPRTAASAPPVGEGQALAVDPRTTVSAPPVTGGRASATDPRATVSAPPVAERQAPVTDPRSATSAPTTPAEGRTVASHPRTVQSPPGPGFGPPPVLTPEPVPSGDPGVRRGRRGTVAVTTLLVAAAVAGLLVWHPWTGSDDPGTDKAGGASPSHARSTPAAFPDDPLLVRLDTDPGSSECHSVIGRRDSTKDNPEKLIDGTCDALPQWSPDHSSFAFTRKTAQGSAVWTANADGSGARRIAAISGGRVSWSPDGERLAVLRRADGVQQLFAVNVSDGSAQQLTHGSGKVEDPAWSPDGKLIAVCLQKTSGWQVHVVDPDRPGAEPRQVTNQPRRALDAVWSPDSRYFAYTAGAPGEGTGGDIRIAKADGSDDKSLVRTAAQEMDPVWSPDGKWVAFVRGPFDRPAIWAIRADGTGARKLTTGSTPEGHPSWR
ncbi:protein kinase domain-containing protein [Streptomyces turgidiscabies]|uniref:Kinase domain protein n=1 Tax=Streptomyces turgidiscabies (strain Car8) TaxID=698760 RepID=L7FI22_STRT8|nr:MULTISPECIES: protein kinase [Streptomyces]ELP71033.1 kinase domain protein [Streptomyces turgidiscabies Car8]MDX3491097.1 protein kinase [Streptomyces turgidiscabies]GAQ72948.1 serine/threonine-protein kinase AfsK [Streptomyces turgidiscabies]